MNSACALLLGTEADGSPQADKGGLVLLGTSGRNGLVDALEIAEIGTD